MRFVNPFNKIFTHGGIHPPWAKNSLFSHAKMRKYFVYDVLTHLASVKL